MLPAATLRLATAALALCLATPVCLAQAKDAPAAGSLAPAVSVVPVAKREIVESVTVTGNLIARDEILISPEVDGLRIVEVLAEEGQMVGKGQVLVRLSRETLDAQMAQTNAALARATAAVAQAESQIIQAEAAQVEAKQALDRTQLLMKTGNTTQAMLEQRVSAARSADGRLSAARDGLTFAKADKSQVEAQKRELQLKLDRTEIRAPAAGLVSRKAAYVGATAMGSADPLFRIVADGKIELEGELPETRMFKVKEGAPAFVFLGEDKIAGTVRLVMPEVDRASRLGRVRIALKPDPRLRVGAFARGEIEIARKTGFAVPLSAVLYGTAGPTVQVVRGDRIEARPVRVGLSAKGYVEIQHGAKEGDQVVAKAGSFLRDGDVIRPVLADADRTASQQPGASR